MGAKEIINRLYAYKDESNDKRLNDFIDDVIKLIVDLISESKGVRCGECKWSYTDERDGLKWCKVHMSHYQVNADGFCSFGERRADERIAE